MKTLKPYHLLILLIPLLMSCDNDIYLVRNGQKVLFQFERANYAWGSFQRGWFIDSEGYVRTYDQPQHWLHLDQYSQISKSDMDANLLNADSVCFKIDAQELAKKVELILKASEGKLSEPAYVMADYGGLTYSCFMFDTTSQKYQSILLSQSGDVEIHNTSNEAKVLFEWLVEINQQVFQ